MRAGTIQLRSGKWEWQLQETAIGSKVVFRLGQRADNEMVAWAPERDLTAEGAATVALDPLHRVWVDEVGMEWTITLEPVRPWRMPGADIAPSDDPETSAMVF